MHIAYGNKITEMVVMWSTLLECKSEVHFGTSPWDLTNKEHVTTQQMSYIDQHINKTYIHRAVLQVR